jgi:hypothetical protein
MGKPSTVAPTAAAPVFLIISLLFILFLLSVRFDVTNIQHIGPKRLNFFIVNAKMWLKICVANAMNSLQANKFMPSVNVKYVWEKGYCMVLIAEKMLKYEAEVPIL